MERYTNKINGTITVSPKYISSCDEGYFGEAINKLSEFEDIIDELLLKQESISKELKELRSEQKTKSVRFRQLLGNKLTNTALLTVFERHGLLPENKR